MIPPNCFARGTRLLTTKGDVAVEDIVAGRQVLVTSSGRTAPVLWVGAHRLDPRRHPTPGEVFPIRIAPGALADGLPGRELVVSPGHGLLLDGVLIPAALLVNGATIVQDLTVSMVEYIHVELDRHDAVIAEGIPAESYLDRGQRGLFESASGAGGMAGEAGFAVCEPGRPELAAVKLRLLERAGAMGHVAAHDPDLHLMVRGKRINPLVWRDARALFLLPSGAIEVRLRSHNGVPAEHEAASSDRRRLGVAISGLAAAAQGGVLADVALDGETCADGFYGLEGAAPATWRWTDGDAGLVLPARAAGPGCLEVVVAMIHPHWTRQGAVLPERRADQAA